MCIKYIQTKFLVADDSFSPPQHPAPVLWGGGGWLEKVLSSHFSDFLHLPTQLQGLTRRRGKKTTKYGTQNNQYSKSVVVLHSKEDWLLSRKSVSKRFSFKCKTTGLYALIKQTLDLVILFLPTVSLYNHRVLVNNSECILSPLLLTTCIFYLRISIKEKHFVKKNYCCILCPVYIETKPPQKSD